MSLIDIVIGNVKTDDNALAVRDGFVEVKMLASAASATGAQTALEYGADKVSWPATFQLTTISRGATDDTVVNIEVSNDNTNWEFYAQLAVVGNSSDGLASGAAPWKYVRANCTTLDNAGTGTFSVYMV